MHMYKHTLLQTKKQLKVASPLTGNYRVCRRREKKENESKCVGIYFVLLVRLDPVLQAPCNNTETFPMIHTKVVVLVRATSWLSTTKKDLQNHHFPFHRVKFLCCTS